MGKGKLEQRFNFNLKITVRSQNYELKEYNFNPDIILYSTSKRYIKKVNKS